VRNPDLDLIKLVKQGFGSDPEALRRGRAARSGLVAGRFGLLQLGGEASFAVNLLYFAPAIIVG
jgi:hypothetical protein